MARKIEHLLRLVGDMHQFSNPTVDTSDELSLDELDLVAAAVATPKAPTLTEEEKPVL